MIRVSTSARQEAWHEIEIVDYDQTTQKVRVKYWLLNKSEASPWTCRRLELGKAAKSETDVALFDLLKEEISADQQAKMDRLLIERIVDWDIEDADAEPGTKLAVTPETVGAVISQVRFWRPLFSGLLDASTGAKAKNS